MNHPPASSEAAPAFTAWLAETLSPQPRACAAEAPLGGRYKVEPVDFEVEELPAYAPSGEGDHLFLWIEKTDVSAMALTDWVARTLEVPPGEVGCAGLKDARAVTRQFISVPRSAEPHLARLEGRDGMRVLSAVPHTNKLKTGHTRGNRFTLVLRELGPNALARAQRMLAILARQGLPNFYGSQRFGHHGRTMHQGAALLGIIEARSERMGRSQLRLALSAIQSAVFNAYLSRRMQAGLLHQVLQGDVMQVCQSGGPFYADDVEATQARYLAHEIVPTGPMPGPKMRAPKDAAAAFEATVLAALGVTAEHFAGQKKRMQGTRRPLVVALGEPQVVEVAPAALRLTFSLPAGSYATGVLHELMGPQAQVGRAPAPSLAVG